MTVAESGVLDSRTLRPGMVVGGKFALLKQLGEGGIGIVFEAEDTWIGRRVALKILHSHLIKDAEMVARFRREARAAAMTNHPNIVGVFEVGQWRDGSPYLVQELLHGETLRDRLVRAGRLPTTEMIELVVPIMGALAVAHRAGIVHRDIKPENIFLALSDDGTIVPKLIDFGIAKIASSENATLTGKLLGTPMYMSPEQVAGTSPADQRTDIWALGAVMYEMLSDHCPHEGPTAASVLGKILTETIRPLTQRAPNVPAELAAVVHRALERDRERRFASMQEFLDALVAYAERPDPTVSARHARSMPPPSESPATIPGLAPAPEEQAGAAKSTPPAPSMQPPRPTPSKQPLRPGTLGGDPPSPPARAAPVTGSEPPPARPSRHPREPPAEWARPIVQPELGWYEGRAPRAPRDLAWYTSAAGEALRDNALDEAVDHAEHAIAAFRGTGMVSGQMRLVQAIALRWLGHYADAERCALEAVDALPRQSPGWYTALGHVGLLGGYLGKEEHFSPILAQLGDIEARGAVPPEHVIATCRLAVSLVRAGQVSRASRALGGARRAAEPGTEDEPMVRGWIFVAVAEIASYRGDPTAYIQHLEAAVACFSEAGDVRNACLQRANIGNGYMQVGAFARAKSLLREALAVGEPMKLGFIAPVRANLGFVLARLGDVDQALEIETAACEECLREHYTRAEMASRIYLGVVLALRGDGARAEHELRTAIAGSVKLPAFRAHALAHLADLLLSQQRTDEARAAALEAWAILAGLEGVEEGESLIRLEHVLALEAGGDAAGALAAVTEARRRLLERADRIRDGRLRRSFLDHIPENARTLTVATRLMGSKLRSPRPPPAR
jgi:serine/threonine protein kinase/tetratricopeptide (TPR) repeat protein